MSTIALAVLLLGALTGGFVSGLDNFSFPGPDRKDNLLKAHG
jgi:hypothetical protein